MTQWLIVTIGTLSSSTATILNFDPPQFHAIVLQSETHAKWGYARWTKPTEIHFCFNAT